MNLGSQFQAKDEGHTRWQDGKRVAGLSSVSPEFSRTVRKNSNGTIYKLLVAFIVCFAFVFLASPQISQADNTAEEALKKFEEVREAKNELEKKYEACEKKIGKWHEECKSYKPGQVQFGSEFCEELEKCIKDLKQPTEEFQKKAEGTTEEDLKQIEKVKGPPLLDEIRKQIKGLKKEKKDIPNKIKDKNKAKKSAESDKKDSERQLKKEYPNTWKQFKEAEKNIKESKKSIEKLEKKKELSNAEKEKLAKDKENMEEAKAQKEEAEKTLEKNKDWKKARESIKTLDKEINGLKEKKKQTPEEIKKLNEKMKDLKNPRDLKEEQPNKFNKRLEGLKNKMQLMRNRGCCPQEEVLVVPTAPAKSYMATFLAIEAGESVEILPIRLTGKRATITFVATADGSPIKGPKTELTKTKAGGTAVVFFGGLSAAVTALVRDTKGNQVSISAVQKKSPPVPEELQPAFEGPVPVTDGSMDATVSVPSGERTVDAAITDKEAKGATVEVVAHKRSESGMIEETAVTASGIPSEACADGELSYQLVTEDNRTIETQMDAFYIGYSMQRIAHVGQTASVKAKITGLGTDQVLNFTFVPDVARHSISPLTNQLTVGEINSGTPITSVTSKMIGEHSFDIVVKVAPPSEERLVP